MSEPIEPKDTQEQVPEQDAPGGGTQPEGTPDRTFTQDEVNRMIADRGKRYGEQQNKAMLESLGFESAEALKAMLDDAQKLRQERMSELERAQEAAKKATDARTKAENERDDAIRNVETTLIKSAFVAAAAALNVAHPDDAYALADRSSVERHEDGEITGVTEAVQALVDSGRIPLKGLPTAPATDAGAGNGTKPSKPYPALTGAERDAARKMNVTPEQYQKQKAEIGATRE